MNEFLKTRGQISASTDWLLEAGYVTHPISAKDWELKIITEKIGDGDLLEMGADGSRILQNAIIKNIKGRKVGIDLSEVSGDNKSEGAEYVHGDLMNTPFDDNSFDTIISQSVIEHEVDFGKFAKECGRLLRSGGKLIVSFDYWETKVNTDGCLLYGLKWNILDKKDVHDLMKEMFLNNIDLINDIDWETKDAVINPAYCSPFPGISYTFGILEFIKQ